MIPYEAVVPILIAQTLMGVAVMLNVAKHWRCRWCDHCRALDRRDAEAKHERYHQFHHIRVQDCQDQKCRGR